MALNANISRNNIAIVGGNFQIDFNIEAQSTGTSGSINQFEFFRNGVSVGGPNHISTAVVDARLHTYIETQDGTFVYKIKYFTNLGHIATDEITLTLDHEPPTIVDFSLLDIEKVGGNIEAEFSIEMSDDVGIQKYEIRDTDNAPGVRSTFTPQISGTNPIETYTLVLPDTFVGTKTLELTAYDFSGNQSPISSSSFTISAVPPVVNSVRVINSQPTLDEYELTIEAILSATPGQAIEQISVQMNSMVPVWEPLPGATTITGINQTVTLTLKIPGNTLASTHIIYVKVLDSSANVGENNCNFILDKTAPTGSIDLVDIRKDGTTYKANVVLRATDSQNVSHYAWAFNNNQPSSWVSITPTQNFEETIPNQNIGSSGAKTAYARFKDSSGNISIGDIKKHIEIDATIPEAQFELLSADKTASGYDFKFQVSANDTRNIVNEKFYAVNSNTSNIITGHTSSWISIAPRQFINEERILTIPNTEAEDPVTFYWEVKDTFGNESPLQSKQIDFDKTLPQITKFEYSNVEKGSSFYRILANLEAQDDFGVIAYRVAFDDISSASWVTLETANTTIKEEVYLDFPVVEFGNTKNYIVEVKDKLGNISANNNFDVSPDMNIPIANNNTTIVSSGSLDANSFIVSFELDAYKPTSNVYRYSITTKDPTIRNWKTLNTPNNYINEIQSIKIPRTSSGIQDFYIFYADEWMNESPAIHVQHDLDATTVYGGISLERVTRTGTNYSANLHLTAFDNKTVSEYELNGTTTAISPVREFDTYVTKNLFGTPGTIPFSVLYRDGFGNESTLYTLNPPIVLELDPPTVEIEYNGTEFDSVNSKYKISLDLVTTDVSDIRDYKFWYDGDGEPSDVELFPPGIQTSRVTRTFEVPFVDVNPVFYAKATDKYDNLGSNTIVKSITTTPPDAPIVSQVDPLANTTYTASGTEVEVDIYVEAAAGSLVRRIFVMIEDSVTPFDTIEIDAGNVPIYDEKFKYEFPFSFNIGKFYVVAESDYGYSNLVPTAFSKVFDTNPPANTVATHVNSINDGTNYVIIVNVQADDLESGITQVNLQPDWAGIPETRFVNQTNALNEDFTLSVPSGYIGSSVSITVSVQDLLGNTGGAIIINCPVDMTNPIVTNIQVNNSTIFAPSIYHGTDNYYTNIRFDAMDVSKITHYKYSASDSEVFNPLTWTPVLPYQTSISKNENVDIANLGFTNGLNTLFIHVRDSHGNISVAGHQFEYDHTPPTVILTHNGEVKRKLIGAIDYFEVPYDTLYTDNYSGIIKRKKWQEDISGTMLNEIEESVSGLPTNLSSNNSQLIASGNLGEITFKENITDRFNNQSANSEFSTYLKTNIPNIVQFALVDNSIYTNTENIFLKLDVETVPMHPTEDTIPLTNYMFSANDDVTWSDTGWQNLPPMTSKHVKTHDEDLIALGFSPQGGHCNVYCYVKDSCQNLATANVSIIFDPVPPVVGTNDFSVNSFSRGYNTYDIVLTANTIDETSGVDQYVISQSEIDTNFANVAGNPVVNTMIQITETEHVPLSDYGRKYFFFKVKDAAGNITEANTHIDIDGELPLATHFSPTSSYSNYYLSTSKNEFRYIISDNYALKNLDYELNGNTYHIETYPLTPNTVFSDNVFSADFSTLSEGIYRIYLQIEDVFENLARIPYEFYFDDTPPIISNFTIKEMRPNPAPGAAANSYTVEFAISASDTVRVNEYKLFEDGNLIETIPMDAVSFTASPTIKTEVNSDLETKTFRLEVYDLSGNMSHQQIVQDMSNGSSLSVDSFSKVSDTNYQIEFSYTASSSGVNFKDYVITTKTDVNYDSGFWNNITGPSLKVVNKPSITKLLSEVNLLPLSTQTFYIHLKDECGNQVKSSLPYTLTAPSPRISSIIPPASTLKREGNYFVGEVEFQVESNDIVGYSISTEKNSRSYKSIPTSTVIGSKVKQKFKIPVSEINGMGLVYIRLIDKDNNESSNYKFSVHAVHHKMERFEICAPDYMVYQNNNVCVLFDTESDPYNIQYAFAIDSSVRPVDSSFSNPSALTTNNIGEYEFDFDIDVDMIGAGDHTLWVWLKTTQGEYSFKTFSFRSEPNIVNPTVSLSVIKAKIYKGKKLVYVEMQVTDLGVGVSEVSIIESPGLHSFEKISTTNFKKHIEIFEYDMTDTSIMNYSGAAKDAVGNQSVADAQTTYDLGTIV